MSRETLTHLNTQTLIGYTDKRGHAWHYRADHQGAEPNHYAGAIPTDDVLRRLFHWAPVEAPLAATILEDAGVRTITDPTRKVIIRPDTQTILGVFKTGYQIHAYDQWLIDNVATILDADLAIASAGLLRGGALAWVQVEMADTLSVEGVDYRPFLTAATSLDGSLATTYQTGAQVVVCDNTLSVALTTASATVKVRHSRHSLNQITTVRDALGIIHTAADQFAHQVRDLTAETVTDARYQRFLTAYTTPAEARPSKRAVTNADTKAEQLWRLWATELRVSPWRGTAYGVLAAVNTYTHHHQPIRGADRATRNTERAVLGDIDQLDRHTLDTLATV